jgi:hypothetical protein
MRRHLKRFLGNRRGVAALEMALALPILTSLFFGCLEVTMNILAAEKVEKLASTSADVVAQSEVATNAGIAQLLSATTEVMKPFDFGTDGVVIITSIYRASGSTQSLVNWRYTGGGQLTATSKFGAVGAQASLPTGFTLNEKENVIVAEVYYRYQPLFPGILFDEKTIYRKALFKPRLSALTSPPT